jgi:hypothetical protein
VLDEQHVFDNVLTMRRSGVTGEQVVEFINDKGRVHGGLALVARGAVRSSPPPDGGLRALIHRLSQ